MISPALFADTPRRHSIELSPGACVDVSHAWLTPVSAGAALRMLLVSTDWKQQRIRFCSPRGTMTRDQPRLTAWYGDPGTTYRYSGIRNDPLTWTDTLANLRHSVQAETGARYNSVLLNRYRSGRDSVDWHSDDEPELGADPTIASLSLGASRNFVLRHKSTKERKVFVLESGDLLVMRGAVQRDWEHAVPKVDDAGERINLTFRWVGPKPVKAEDWPLPNASHAEIKIFNRGRRP
jgi:alkylated DNA repair dioxygenase AlkB